MTFSDAFWQSHPRTSSRRQYCVNRTLPVDMRVTYPDVPLIELLGLDQSARSTRLQPAPSPTLQSQCYVKGNDDV